jgi:cyanophycinase-like exopeptidase
MVLGQFIYTATNPNEAESDTLLKNPFDQSLTLGSGFLDVAPVQYMLLDTHFQQRDRMGRLLAFLARIALEGNTNIRGVSCDEQSVILVSAGLTASLAAQTSGPDHVCYFLSTSGLPEVGGPGPSPPPLHWPGPPCAV